MLDYEWPGNVRELENCVKYLACLQLTRPVDKYDLPMQRRTGGLGANDADLLQKPFTSARMEFEKRYVTEALRKRTATSPAPRRKVGSTARRSRG